MRHRWQAKVGVALGGGAARGMAHVGVLRALSRENIPIDVIVGTSMGAIIGGAFAATGDIAGLERKVREVLTSEQFRKNKLSFLRETRQQRKGLFFSMKNLIRRGIFYGVSNLRPSFLSAEEFAHSLEAIIPDVRIQDLPIPFGAVALDLESAEEVVICNGKLRLASGASSAIPGILPPVKINGRTLIDGGWVDKVPVLPAFKLGADVVIAVDITADLDSRSEYRRGVDIMVRANAIKDDALVGFSRRLADVVIEPDVGRIHWADFGSFERCIDRGDKAATKAIDGIRELVRHEKLLSVLRPSAGKKMAEHHLKDDTLRINVE